MDNKQRCGAMENQYYAICRQSNTHVCVIYDGDDFFEDYNYQTCAWQINTHVIAYINDVYQNPAIWMTYGQFRQWPGGKIGFCRDMPEWIVQHNAFRDYGAFPSHLRTFYAGLFKKINKEDLMYQGEFVQMTSDMAAMFPMIEMARKGHFAFIPKVLLAYNVGNSLNNFKVSQSIEKSLDVIIRARTRYEPIENLFIE